jgi:hypothetical protein
MANTVIPKEGQIDEGEERGEYGQRREKERKKLGGRKEG